MLNYRHSPISHYILAFD